ncbi:MAG: EpsI family protein [Thermodesulfobacteriota bacterium]|nr:EpsI family protein [Thermodesulfobacteriota bacterium]
MGHSLNKRLIILIVALLISGAFLRWNSIASHVHQPDRPTLSKALNHIPGWEKNAAVKLETKFINTLKLDDFINIRLKNNNMQVSLYIGQYLSPEKVGAAHDPLTCLPGQGWKVTDRRSGEMSVPVNNKSYSVSYETMVAELSNEKQLFLYWFQAFDATYVNTLWQKIAVFRNVLLGRSQDSAFVRLSTPFNDQTRAEAEAALLKFVKDFYPVYLTYLQTRAE